MTHGSTNPRDTSRDAAFVPVSTVRRVLYLSHKTVLNLINTGEIPARRYGRSYRIPRKWLDEQLECAQ